MNLKPFYFLFLGAYAQTHQLNIALQNVIDTASYMAGHTGVSLGVALPEQPVSSLASGYKDRDLSMELAPSDRMGLGSGTKMFTAAAVLKLVEGNHLNLDDVALPHMDLLVKKITSKSLQDYLGPEIRNVTVRNLLHMTSGILDLDSKALRESALAMDGTETMNLHQMLSSFDQAHEERRGYQETLNDRFTCKPGTCGEYSSTNYLLLGMLLAQKQGLDHWQDYDQSSFIPQGVRMSMPRTLFPMRGTWADFTDVHGYSKYDNKLVDVFHVPTSMFAVANTLTTGSESATFLKALLGQKHEILSPKVLSEMMKLRWLETGWGNKVSAGQFYGMGMRDMSANIINNPLKMLANPEVYTSGILFGHDGMTMGFHAFTGYAPRHDSAFSFIVNHNQILPYFNFMVRKTFDLICPLTEPVANPLQATYENRDAFLNQKVYRMMRMVSQ